MTDFATGQVQDKAQRLFERRPEPPLVPAPEDTTGLIPEELDWPPALVFIVGLGIIASLVALGVFLAEVWPVGGAP